MTLAETDKLIKHLEDVLTRYYIDSQNGVAWIISDVKAVISDFAMDYNKCSPDYEAECARLADENTKAHAEMAHWRTLASRHEDELKRCHVIIQTIEAMIGRELPL